jgi:hypothetical protein
MKYDFIAQHQQEYPVTTMCQVLEVSAAGIMPGDNDRCVLARSPMSS